MPDQEITQEQLEQSIEDATYLQDEAEALRYVIDNVPYDQAPPEGQSIVEKLILLDHIQVHYFRPVFEQVNSNPRMIKVENFSDFESSFEIDQEKPFNIQKILNKLAKHRAALIIVLKNISLIDWDRVLYKDDKEITLYQFTREMIRIDHKILKEIADTVMLFQKEAENQREIINKQKEQPR